MDNSSIGLHNSARAGVKTSLAVCCPELEHRNMLITIGHFLGSVTKSFLVLESMDIHLQGAERGMKELNC